jgi:hypothetical protein
MPENRGHRGVLERDARGLAHELVLPGRGVFGERATIATNSNRGERGAGFAVGDEVFGIARGPAALQARLCGNALVVHLLRDLGDRLAVDEVAEDALDDATLLGNDDQLQPVGAQPSLLVVFGFAVRNANVPVAAAAHAEASKTWPIWPRRVFFFRSVRYSSLMIPPTRGAGIDSRGLCRPRITHWCRLMAALRYSASWEM